MIIRWCYLAHLKDAAEKLPYSLLALIWRFAAAANFWRSGRTKVHGLFSINDSTFDLFREEYRVPLIPSDIAAVMATCSEHLFSVLLVLGLATRLSALGLLGMTLVIQTFVYPANWPDHILWTAALLPILARGPGKVSLDQLIWPRLYR